MTGESDNKIVLVVRPTRLDDLAARFNTAQQAQFCIEHLGADFADYLAEHKRYREATGDAETGLRELGRVQRLERRVVPNFVFGARDSVVVPGQDGLVANTLKYLDGQRVVGVNPDPKRWDGVLLPFTVADLPRVMREELQGRRPVKTVTMARATLNTGRALYGVNDLFIGPRSHISARYTTAVDGHREQQSSSGIIVSAGLGSTGWLKSIYAGWAATTQTLLHRPLADAPDGSFPWDAEDADYLHYVVREPFPSRTSAAHIVIGRIPRDQRMMLASEMAENGVIFSDGIEADYLEFNSGTEATIGVAERPGRLVA
jgi:NAD kinase